MYVLLERKLMHRKTKRQITESKHVQQICRSAETPQAESAVVDREVSRGLAELTVVEASKQFRWSLRDGHSVEPHPC